jgi:hypothetical protein
MRTDQKKIKNKLLSPWDRDFDYKETHQSTNIDVRRVDRIELHMTLHYQVGCRVLSCRKGMMNNCASITVIFFNI